MSLWSRLLDRCRGRRAPLLEGGAVARLEAWRAQPEADLKLPHFRTRYVVVDVETSGLDMMKDRLISIGAVAVNGGLIDFQDAFEVILRQEEVSDPDNILLHGIGGTAQRAGREPVTALLDFLDYIGKSPLVAYHARFDETMIARAMARRLGEPFRRPWLDLAWVMPELYRERLDVLATLDRWLEMFDIENIQRHNAVSDCYATAKLLQVALARGTQKGADTPAKLLELERMRRWMRRAG